MDLLHRQLACVEVTHVDFSPNSKDIDGTFKVTLVFIESTRLGCVFETSFQSVRVDPPSLRILSQVLHRMEQLHKRHFASFNTKMIVERRTKHQRMLVGILCYVVQLVDSGKTFLSLVQELLGRLLSTAMIGLVPVVDGPQQMSANLMVQGALYSILSVLDG